MIPGTSPGIYPNRAMADSGSASSLSKDTGLKRYSRTSAGAFLLIEGESACDAKSDEALTLLYIDMKIL